MPQAKNKNAPGFEILLHPPLDASDPTAPPPVAPANYNPTYHPGSIINGTVSLSSTSDVSIGQVDLVFYARSKVKIVQSNGQSSTTYRSRANFFTIRQRLFEGGYTFKSGKWDWPFAITCPTRVDGDCLRGGTDSKGRANTRFKPRGEPAFLNTEGADKEHSTDESLYKQLVSNHELPPSMRYYHGLFGRTAEAYIEYVLVATMNEPERKGISISANTRTSTRVIRVATSVPDIHNDWQFTSVSHHPMFRTSKLSTAANVTEVLPIIRRRSFSKTDSNISNPDIKGLDKSTYDDPVIGTSRRTSSLFSKLSLSTPNSSSLFSRSSTPKLTLALTITHPQKIQVAHPSPIPFTITIIPDFTAGATTLDPSQLPKVLIRTFSCSLMCCTKTRVTYWKHDQKDSKTVNIPLCETFPINKIIDLASSSSLAPQNSSSTSPSAALAQKAKPADFSTNSFHHQFTPTPSSLNLGTLSNLRVQGAKLGHVTEFILTPTFSTYNIARVFNLKYTVEIEVLGTGKTERIRGESVAGVVVVGAANGVRVELEGYGMGGPGGELPGYEDLYEDQIVGCRMGRIDDDDAEFEDVVEGIREEKMEGVIEKGVLKKREARREERKKKNRAEEEGLPRYQR